MSKVVFDISMSLDGFITAANRRAEEPLGDGGQRLHEWAFGADERNRQYLERAVAGLGAVITVDPRGASGVAGGRGLHVRDRRHRKRTRAGQGGRR